MDKDLLKIALLLNYIQIEGDVGDDLVVMRELDAPPQISIRQSCTLAKKAKAARKALHNLEKRKWTP